MEPYVNFRQRVIDNTHGHCFAVSAKWVGLMLDDEEKAGRYLTSTESRNGGGRTWKTTRARMVAYGVAANADVALQMLARGPSVVQANVSQGWLRKYADNADIEVVVADNNLQGVESLIEAIERSEAMEAFLVSAQNPAHTVGAIRLGGGLHWFDPNDGAYDLGNEHVWKPNLRTVCRQTGFVPDWLLGITL